MVILKKGLVVSCQATEDEPMFGSEIMAKMALAAQMGGAVGVRVNTYSDLVAVRKAVDIPILGLIKTVHPGFWPYITTTMEDVDKVVESGAEIVCIDATFYPRFDGNDFPTFYKLVRERHPNVEIMADISTFEEGIRADKLGCDYVSTTLWGYTPDTVDEGSGLIQELREPNIELVGQLAKVCKAPIVAEGRFFNSENAIKAFKAGAHAVVIGAGITRPQIITKKIVDDIKREIDL
ncbi:MAG: N-acetylmannosamine-6-phosphate 2-epimerase [Erysipelotrichaceae bacterium]|nr:N-acetylmannosamine-6-phosphate 2-epimerase [Erysipelotrichaceae bacterium]